MSTFIPSKEIYLKGLAAHMPKRVVDNAELIKWMGAEIRTSWIERRTGIRSRYWVESNESCSDLAVHSASATFSRLSNTEKTAVRQLVLTTSSGDFISPPTSPLVQDRLSLSECGAFDLGAACAGFVSGLHVAGSLVQTTHESHLLIASEVRSKFISPNDFNTAVLFGDGASSVLLSESKSEADFRLLGTYLVADGSVSGLISIPAGGSRNPFREETSEEDCYLKMEDGAAVFLKAVHAMSETPNVLLKRLGIKIEELSWIVPHQANLLLLKELEKRIPGAQGKVIETVSYTGNTSGASIGIALETLLRKPELKSGDRVLLASAGGGGLAACAVLERV